MTIPNWLTRAASRSAEHAWTFGTVIATYCELEGTTREGVASGLGCSREVLMWLSLCRRPAGEGFRDQIQQLAERFDVDPAKLAAIVRRVDAVAALRSVSATADQPMLLAARDRSEGEGEA